jgi:ribosomal protein L29
MRLRAEVQRLQGDVNGLRSANSRLTRDRNFRDLTIRELRQAVTQLEAELLAARAEHATGAAEETSPNDANREDSGEVHAFPRRPLREGAQERAGSGSGELRDVELLATQTVIAMPNYEDDRRFG